MSVENLKEYARRCAAEPELRARARAIGTEDMEAHQRHAASLGLDWTMDDMLAFRKEVTGVQGESDMLTEEDLDQVAGGVAMVTGIVVGIVAGIAAGAVVGVVGGAAAGAAVAGSAGSSW